VSPAALNVKDAAAYLGVTADWLARSDCPRVRLGRLVRYRVVDLDAFLAARLTHGTAA